MKKVIIISVFLLALAGFHSSFAQQKTFIANNYRVLNWTTDDGLAQSEIYTIIQDHKGFVWFGSKGGLSRFDGKQFKIFLHNPKDNRSICSDEANAGLVEDSLHNIWIGTGQGLARYDILADTFTNINPRGNHFTVFWATKDKIFCIESANNGVDSVIWAYDIHNLSKKVIGKLAPYGDYWGPGHNYSILDTLTNSIWLLGMDSTRRHLGLLQVNIDNGQKEFFLLPCTKSNIPGHDHTAEAMKFDRLGYCLWINGPDGLIRFDLRERIFSTVETLRPIFDQKNYHRFVGIEMDAKGRVWFATLPNGIIVYNPADQTFHYPFSDDSLAQKEISDANCVIYRGNNGIVWIGTWLRKGIYQVNPFDPPLKRYVNDPSNPHSISYNWVYNAVRSGNRQMWVGTRNGINSFDPQTGNFHLIQMDRASGLKNLFATPLIVDSLHGAGLFLSDSGVMKINMVNGKISPLRFVDADGKAIQVRYVVPTGCLMDDKCLLISDEPIKRIFLADVATGIASQVILPDPKFNYFKPVLGKGNQWLFLRTDDNDRTVTFRNINRQWVKTPHPFDSVGWKQIFYNDSDDSYWVSQFQELVHYDGTFRPIRSYTLKDGIPELEIFNIISDNDGNIWFNTDRAIYQLNTVFGTILRLAEKDGFLPQNYEFILSAAKDDAGDLYFPAGLFGKGLDRISPSKFISAPSNIYLQSLEINQKPYPLQTGVDNLDLLSLRYFENKITITTGIIDYFSQGKGSIRYKLEGGETKNTNWQYAPNYYTIRFEELPPGNYTLSVQAGNASNQFIGPVKKLLIQISPAFWNTWWFRITALLVFLGTGYLILRWRIRQRFRTELEKSEKETQMAEMRQRTAELQKQASELEMQALRAQMNPHFIFNSLNSINRFILQNDRLQASEYLTKFSRLVRMILQNSQASLISLENELESLTLYLELEALRFEHRFDFKISVPGEMDISDLQIPPLIIQPYAENAIWHGLMHKEEKGQLDIELSEDEYHVYVNVTDNGIGRKRSAELSSKSATKHKSMGLKITANRIAMLENSNGLESPVTIHDLENEDGTAAGTEVIIKIPVLYA
jgi:ligand-binding sensor domain-containing protein